MMNMSVRNLTAVAVDKGLITVINEQGHLEHYAQRGIAIYNNEQKYALVKAGKLNPAALSFKELPRNIRIQYECPDVQGRAYATYNPNRKARRQ